MVKHRFHECCATCKKSQDCFYQDKWCVDECEIVQEYDNK